MGCKKRKKGLFGIDDVALASIVGSIISAGTSIGSTAINTNAQKKAVNNQNKVNNTINTLNEASNQEQEYNNQTYDDVYKQKLNAFKNGGKKRKCNRNKCANGGEVKYYDRVQYLTTLR